MGIYVCPAGTYQKGFFMVEGATSRATRILMVDDSQADFFLTKSSFESGGDFHHSLEWAPTYKDGLAKMCQALHDIFIVDYKLDGSPEGSGLDLVREIRLQNIDIPVILLTGMDTHAIPKEECNKLNISRCLSKDEKDPGLLISIIADTILHFKKMQ